MKFGRNRPHPALVERQPRYKTFRTAAPIVVPDAWSYSLLCAPALQTMLANGPDPSVTVSASVAASGLGDCTCASVAHCIDVWTAGGAAPATVTADQTIGLYERACGYVLDDASTDEGGDELTVLGYVAAHGIDGNGLHQIAGVASLDATDLTSMREAAFLTGAVLFCAELPNGYPSVSLAGDGVWDVTGPPNPQQGHAFPAFDYTTNGPNGKHAWKVVTWGGFVWYTTDAAAHYSSPAQGGSANAGFDKEWVGRVNGLAPNALDTVDLSAAFQRLGGVLT